MKLDLVALVEGLDLPGLRAELLAKYRKMNGDEHFVLWGAVTTLLLVVWASLARLDVVSVAEGEVVPSSLVKAVQHLEGGIVSQILVREGQIVRKDQPLVELDAIASGADVGELTLRLSALQFDLLRLEVEREGGSVLPIPAELNAKYPDRARKTNELFLSRREKFVSGLQAAKEAVTQREQAMGETSARIRNNRASFELLREQIRISNELMADHLTNRLNHLTLLKEASQLNGKIEEDQSGLKRAESALKEAQEQATGYRNTYLADVNEQLRSTQREFEEMTERMKKFSDSLRRTVLRAPVDGVVKTMHVTTRGGVVKAGETVIDLVPEGDRLVVEAKLPVYDVGFIKVGQRAYVRLASSDGSRFGHLDGEVINVSPDTIVTEKAAFYKVRIEIQGDRFRDGDAEYHLFPGVTVSSSIVTGDRSVFVYLLGPLVGRMHETMRER